MRDDLPDGVRVVQLGDHAVLWSDRTGRGIRDSTTARTALRTGEGPAAVLARLAALGLSPDGPSLLSRIPTRNAHAVLLPDSSELWCADPMAPTPGGFEWRSLALEPREMAMWRASNGTRTLSQVAERAHASEPAALRFAARMTALSVQALQLRALPARADDPGQQRLVSPPRPDGPRLPHQVDADGGTDLARWHAEEIHDPGTHFDLVETTVAHAFELPHAALEEQGYGARLQDRLALSGPVGRHGLLVEVGPGTGALAAAWIKRATEMDRLPRRYVRVDASPALLAAQAARAPDTEGVHGLAEALPLEDGSVDLLLSNEVIADLRAAPEDEQIRSLRERHGLEPLPDGARYNVGTWQFIEEIARVLRPGGRAFVSEFGDLDEVPRETTHLDHPEVSIHFGHARDVARSCGLEADVVRLDHLLGANLTATWLSRPSTLALRALCARSGMHLEARAWTVASAPRPLSVEGLVEVPITRDGPGPVITRFQALLLRKPET